MIKVVGIRNASFKGSNGEDITGQTIYCVDLDPILEQYGSGHSVDRFFVSDSKLSRSASKFEVSKSYEIFYNRYGKIDSWKEVQN